MAQSRHFGSVYWWLCCILAASTAACAASQAEHPPAEENARPPLPAPADAAKRTPPAPPTTGASPTPAAPLRVWIDEFFFAEGETVLLREALAAAAAGDGSGSSGGGSGGTAVLAGDSRNRVFHLKSYQQTSKADLLWTGRVGCYEAFKRPLNASHAVSCVPGTQALSDKARLVASLEAAYGPAAWGIVPHSYRLPQQYADMAARMRQEQHSGQSGLWVLKEDVHRGKGVGVVAPHQALARALERAPGASRGPGVPLKHVLAQRFLGEQLLVAGRPFYIRLWAVLAGAAPARAFLWDGGVVVFGQLQRPDQTAEALIVNLWNQDRKAAAPWSLSQLEAHLEASTGSVDVPRRLRRQLHAVVAASLAAGLPNVRRAAAALPGFQGGSFEVLGIDFLVDAALKPWLVEVNFLPSMARKLLGCGAGAGAGGSGSSGGSDGSVSGGGNAADAGTSSNSDAANSGGSGISGGTKSDAGSSSGSDSGGDGTSTYSDAGNNSSGTNFDASSSGGSGSSGGTNSDAGSSSSGGGTPCQLDNPFDVQKQGFVRSLLALLTGRHRRMPGQQVLAAQLLWEAAAAVGGQSGVTDAGSEGAAAAVAEAGSGEGAAAAADSAGSKEDAAAAGGTDEDAAASEADGEEEETEVAAEEGVDGAAVCMSESQLRQLLAMQAEQAEAVQLGFVPLTELMYRSLACMAARAAGSSSTADPSVQCSVLAELAPPAESPPHQHDQKQQQQQCSALITATQRLLSRAQRWGERLLLEAGAAAAWVRSPVARLRVSASPPTPPPYQLTPSDRRMLAWMQQGSPELGSLKAVQDFCAAGGTPP